MKNDEEIIGEAVRVEYDKETGQLFLVFEITNQKYQQDIKNNWSRDIEFRLIDKKLAKYE
jgi:hypothetical protein